MTEHEYAEAVERVSAKLSAGEVVVEIWDMRDKTVMTETTDNRLVADAYRIAFVHARRADGSAGELQERLPIRRLDVERSPRVSGSMPLKATFETALATAPSNFSVLPVERAGGATSAAPRARARRAGGAGSA